MARLSRPRETPPDGFWFLVPESTTRIEGWDLTELVTRVIEHREWRLKVPQDREATQLEVERQICMCQFPGICQAEPGEDYQPIIDRARDFSTETVMAASKTALEFLKDGTQLVDKAQAERRAAICRGCRLNRQSPSWACSVLCATLEALVPAGRREPGLNLCGVCSCSLPAKILLPEHVFQPANDALGLRFPSYCWQNRPLTDGQEKDAQ